MSTSQENAEKIILLLKGSSEDQLQGMQLISAFSPTDEIPQKLQSRISWRPQNILWGTKPNFTIDDEYVSIHKESDLLLLWIQMGFVDPNSITFLIGNASSIDILKELLPLLCNLEKFIVVRYVGVPREIIQCKKLKYISTKEIPDWIGELKSLYSIDAVYASNTSLPESILDLPNIAFIDLWGSQIQHIPMKLVEKESVKQIRFTRKDYSFTLPTNQLYHQKVLWSKPMRTVFPRLSMYFAENVVLNRLQQLGIHSKQQ